MEQIQFSKPKLTLAIITAPRQAFEEIIARGLLGSGIAITASAGLFALLWKLLAYYKGINSVYDLGIYNPVTGLAWMFGAALAIQSFSKFLGGQGRLLDTVTALGWSHIPAVLAFIVAAGALFTVRLVTLAFFAMYPWFLVVSIVAVQTAHSISVWRGVAAAIFGFFSILLLRNLSYSISASINHDLDKTLQNTSAAVVPGGEVLYLLTLAILAGVTLYLLLRQMDWRPHLRIAASVGGFLIVGAMAGAIALVTVKLDPVGHLKAATAAYNAGRYDRAAAEFDRVLAIFPGDFQAGLYLGHTYLAAGRYDPAEQQFRDLLGSTAGSAGGSAIAVRAQTGLGAVKYARGDYKGAVSEFDRTLKLWPNYREAHSRKALAFARMSKLDDARKAAKAALDAGADSAIPYIVLAQVFSLQGNEKKARDNFGMVTAINPDLADKIGRDPQDWGTAVENVTNEFLKYPLDTEPARVASPRRGTGTRDGGRGR